mmetsp:Transcript_139319/g.347323  ORF Transcript_139319/g.347323 Transcript_139319/m.347323 type:complete len:158 (-) Transcript_139319:111-584(-)
MSFNDQIHVLKDDGCVLCACCCSECTWSTGTMFALSAKACCFSVGIGWKGAIAAAAGYYAAGAAGAKKKTTKSAAALAAAGAMDMVDDNAIDFNACESCYDSERGCCEVVAKLCCCYYEVQCPPGQDIGCGCCGARCCDDATAEEAEEAPEQQMMMG